MAEVGSPQIGPYILEFRKRQSMTLDTLSKASGVSRSMLSQIERGQTNPTLATVWALANALRVDVSELIGSKSPDRRPLLEISPAAFTPEIRTEDSSCVLRILSPADRVGRLEWYEVHVQPKGALVSAPHVRGTREHLTLLEGSLTVIAGDERVEVPCGATARYPADLQHEIRNLTDLPARALLVVVSD